MDELDYNNQKVVISTTLPVYWRNYARKHGIHFNIALIKGLKTFAKEEKEEVARTPEMKYLMDEVAQQKERIVRLTGALIESQRKLELNNK